MTLRNKAHFAGQIADPAIANHGAIKAGLERAHLERSQALRAGLAWIFGRHHSHKPGRSRSVSGTDL